jgi:hypothetical protein
VFKISYGQKEKRDGCSVFFVVTNNGVVILGIGSHETSTVYRLDWKHDDWAEGWLIQL